MAAPAGEHPQTSAAGNDFDFPAAVRRSLAEFPRLRSAAVFLNTDTPKKTYGHWQARLRGALMGKSFHNSRYIAQAQETESSSAHQPNFAYPLQTLVFKPDDALHQALAPTLPQAQINRYVFNHELGHLTVPDAYGGWKDGKPYPENAADSFAIVKHLQENKDDVLLPLVASWGRAYRFVVSGCATHLTSPSIEALVAARHAFNLDGLHGKALAGFAADHAAHRSPNQTDIDEARYIYGSYAGMDNLYPLQENTGRRLVALAETALATENAFAFQLGLIVFRPLLHPAGVEINGITFRLQEEQRAELETRFEEKAKNLGIPALIRAWKENADQYCARQSGSATRQPAASQPPLKLSIS
jgi:hypothetical protein